MSTMWLLLLACADERGPRDPADVVEYDGYVFAGPTDTELQLTGGSMVFTPDEGDVVEATQPFVDDFPGYWRAELPPGTPYTLRIVGDTGYPAVWRGTSPGADGSWFSGALFGADTDQVDAFLEGLDLPVSVVAEPLAGASVAHLWGYPWDAEGWDCGLLTVNGARPVCYLQDPSSGFTTRVESGPLTWFVALNLPPGEVTVDDGQGASETYVAEAGDMVYAFWFSGGGGS